ncbi:hypothetical protein M0R04_09000 [Candidatus Dojkabacteria bacterium]|jgi:hypothetical protein|nr:hypothetical protein [Candidatus Dojkabacteria bacterium]
MARKSKTETIDLKSNNANGRPRTKNQAILTIFILLFPVLLLAMIGLVGDLFLKIMFFVYEAVLIKNFIDDYYAGRL